MKFNKPKFWDLREPNLLSYLLSPLTLFIRLNNLYLKFISKKKFKKIISICVGNIYLGGTGKTPTTLKLYDLLKKTNLKVVTAKKFYSDQKDEQIILNNKSKFISLKNRSEIFKKAIEENFDLVIFDDGLQEKKVDYDVKFVCFDTKNWIGNGCLIPSGPLRENIESLKKYDGVFLKHDSEDINTQVISSKIKKINPNIRIFNTFIKIKHTNKFNLTNKYYVFSGIGNSNSFKDILIKNNFEIVEEKIFPDHYDYQTEDLVKILDEAKKMDAQIITTEKDFVKIPNQYKDNINFLEIDLSIPEEDGLKKFIISKIHETN